MQTFIPVSAARSLILDAARSMDTEDVLLDDALGRTLAAPIVSRDDIPPFENSAMDGYAVRAEDLQDLPATLRVIEDIPAGRSPERTVEPGTCARIMTGAPMPDGADAVAPVEWTEDVEDGTVRFDRAPASGKHVRPAAEDVERGEEVVPAGTVVTPPVLGIAATLGYAELPVRVQPRLAVISTGDELVDVSAALGPGQIRDSNGPALVAQAKTAGARVLPPLRARDDADHIRTIIEQALGADVLLFSGGVSVGEYDYVKQVLDDMGMEMLFWKVRQRPGKPLAFGLLQDRLVFGLPGNPVSSAMCFEQYVRPTLATMLGRQVVLRPQVSALLTAPTRKKKGFHYFARGIATYDDAGRLRVRDTGPQGSNLYHSVVRANCIMHLPEELENPGPGTRVQIEWLDW